MILPMITSLYALSAILAARFFGAPWPEILALGLFSGLICVQLILFYAVGRLAMAFLPSPPSAAAALPLIRRIDAQFTGWGTASSFRQGLAALGIFYPLFFGFTAFKSLIPLFSPYGWDPTLSELDRTLHGGYFPHSFLPTTLWTIRIAEWVYYLWFPVVLVANGYAAFFDMNPRRRKLYLLATALSWIVMGSLGATLLSSVGPLFYGDFYAAPPNPYADIQANLAMATEKGEVLWPQAVAVLLDITRNTVICDLNGISAMPSMHVGISFLITLYAFTLHRAMGWGMAIFTALIFLSSLILGFHYAIDGYVACAGIAIIWFAVRALQPKTPAN